MATMLWRLAMHQIEGFLHVTLIVLSTWRSLMMHQRHMEDAFNLMNKYGYDAVKTGYVGDIIPRGVIVLCTWRSLMMHHQLNTLRVCILIQAFQIKVWIRSNEIEYIVFPVTKPVFPTDVPSSVKLGQTDYAHAKPNGHHPANTAKYLVGWIHDVSSILQGSLRLRMRLLASISRASSLTITVRQGVSQGVCMNPFKPVASGVSHDSKVIPRCCKLG